MRFLHGKPDVEDYAGNASLREHISVARGAANTYHAQVFDLIEELDFAGIRLLGAACVLHSRSNIEERAVWTFLLRAKTVTVITDRAADAFRALLDQGGLNSWAKFLQPGGRNSLPH